MHNVKNAAQISDMVGQLSLSDQSRILNKINTLFYSLKELPEIDEATVVRSSAEVGDLARHLPAEAQSRILDTIDTLKYCQSFAASGSQALSPRRRASPRLVAILLFEDGNEND